MNELKIEIISQNNANYCHLLDSISSLWSEARESHCSCQYRTARHQLENRAIYCGVRTGRKGKGRIWQATPHSVGERPHHTPWEGIQPVELDIHEEIFIKCRTLSHKIPLRAASVLYFELMFHISWRNFSKSFL